MVGRSLEVLLQGAGYGTRIIEEPTTKKPLDVLEGIRLVLVAPTPSTESRERFLASMECEPGDAAIPVLTLSVALTTVLSDQTGCVPWPCRLEDLKNQIEAALLTAPRAKMAPPWSGNSCFGRPEQPYRFG